MGIMKAYFKMAGILQWLNERLYRWARYLASETILLVKEYTELSNGNSLRNLCLIIHVEGSLV